MLSEMALNKNSSTVRNKPLITFKKANKNCDFYMAL